MVGWGSGPGMIEEPELEEGEAFDCKDDTRIDPDVALSYIGDKVQSILGHFQKDFEGGAFAENLGAKYGGYGSFLPTYQHSPSHRSQLKSPAGVQISNMPGSPNHISAASYGRNSSILVQMGPAPSSPPSMQPSQIPKASSEDASNKQTAVTNFGRAETLLGIVELPPRKLDNPLKLRLKVRPDLMAQYNALGLASPPSSAESSPEESGGLPVESFDTHDESPDNIIQIMTSFPVAGSMLLSPLCEDLLHVLKKMEYSIDNDNDTSLKSSAICNRLLMTDDFRGKKQRSVGGVEKNEKSEKKCAEKTSGRLSPEWMPSSHESDDKHLSVIVTDSEKDVQVREKRANKVRVKERAESSDSVKAASLGHSSGKSYNKPEHRYFRCNSADKVLKNQGRISEDDILVDRGQIGSNGNRNYASHAYVDISEGKRVKGSSNISSAKVDLQPESGEEGQLGVPRAMNYLLPEKKVKGIQFSGKLASKVAVNLHDSDRDALKNRDSVKKVHLGKNCVADTIAGCTVNMKLVSERPSGGRVKKSNLEAAKTKPTHAEKLKDRSTKERDLGSLTSLTYMSEPSTAAISSNGEIITALEQTVEEDWVECDKCDKWRLLPYGRSSSELSGNWMCSMLDWLPGMNHCDVSEDETTRAVQPTYPQNTISQYNLQAHVNNANYGVISAGFNQNYQNFASDQVADQVKQKPEGKQSTNSTSNAVPSCGKKNFQRRALETGSAWELNQYSAAQNAKDKLDLQHVNKSITSVEQLNKQKDEHAIGDGTNPRKKSRKESFQHVDETITKIKVAGETNLNNFQKSGGHLCTSSDGLTSGLSNKAALGYGMKKNTQQVAISAGKGKIQIHLKKSQYQMLDLPDKGALGEKACNGREVSTSMEYEDSQHHSSTWQNNGSNLHHGKISMQEQKDGDSHKDKKTRVSQVKEKESKICNGDVLSKRKGVESRVRPQESKECLIDRALETEQQARKLKEKGLTIEDLVKLKKDLGCEELPTAATSSSSKVSDTRRIKIRYLDARSSPGESVSSSPARIPYPNIFSPMMMQNEAKTNSRFNDALSRDSVKKSSNMNGGSEMRIAKNGKITVASCSVSSGNLALDFRETDAKQNSCELAPGVEYGNNEGPGKGRSSTVLSHKNPEQNLVGNSGEPVSSQIDRWNEGSHIEPCQGNILGVPCASKYISGVVGSLKKSSVVSRPSETYVVKDSAKSLEDTAVACLQNETDNFISRNEAEKSLALDSRPANRNICSVTASSALTKAKDVLREAEELRTHADLIKKSGFCSESNYGYFQAALKFLHGASLLEACNGGEPGKNMELNLTEMYCTAARLCKTCACEYQKDHDVAAAALAYKCVEVACMRVVNIKSLTTQRIWHDSQSSLQMVPQGESPASSASDVDNFNNSTMADKTTLSKGNVSHSRNHDIALCNRPIFLQLLDFTGDAISAMDAAKKSQDMFAAACVKLEDSQNKAAVISLKRVFDFSFQDVAELIRLTWHAFSTINCQGPIGCRE